MVSVQFGCENLNPELILENCVAVYYAYYDGLAACSNLLQNQCYSSST